MNILSEIGNQTFVLYNMLFDQSIFYVHYWNGNKFQLKKVCVSVKHDAK